MNFIMTKLSSAKKSIESALSESFGWRNKNNPVYFKFPANYNLYEEIRKTNIINEYTFEDCELFLDAYYIVSDLGKGGFGNVKLAYNKVEERWVALKIMNKKSDKPVRTAFLAKRETRLMSLLSHQNLCKFYRAIETDECYIIEMEHVNGCTLQSLIKKKQIIPEKEASGIFAQLVEGMNYLHAHNIIHRDLKPDNIMIDENGMIKIIDLGFATTYEYDQHVKSFCGTGFYKSPEMVRKSKYVGPEVDVWSMGVVLFCMTHGTRPFKGANGNELNFNILRGEYEMNDMLSADLKDLLSKMIKTDVRKRINTKDIGSHRWIGNFQFDEYPLMPITNVDNFVRVHLMHFGFDEEFILSRMGDQRSVISRFYNLVASIEESKRFDHSFPMSVEQFSFEISAISESKTNSINFVRSNIGRIPFDIQKQSTKKISGLICADEFTIYNKLISYVERCDYVFVCKDGYMQILVSSKVSVLLRIYIKKASEKTCKIAIKFMCGADVLFWDVVTDMLKKKFCHKE